MNRMTNRDKIMSLSNIELAELLNGNCGMCVYKGNGDGRCYSATPLCTEGIKKWLESEAEENGENEIL